MKKTFGSSRNLSNKYNKLLYDDNIKNDSNNELTILNKKIGNLWVNNFLFLYYLIYIFSSLKSKANEIEDDSTSSDSYIEKIPSFIILEKFHKITDIMKDLIEKCKITYI